MDTYRVNFSQVGWESPVKGLRFKAVRQAGRQLRLVEYTKEMPPHWCEKGHIGFVLEGQLEIRFAREAQTYAAGDGIFIPGGGEHKHMGKALTDLVRVIFVEDI